VVGPSTSALPLGRGVQNSREMQTRATTSRSRRRQVSGAPVYGVRIQCGGTGVGEGEGPTAQCLSRELREQTVNGPPEEVWECQAALCSYSDRDGRTAGSTAGACRTKPREEKKRRIPQMEQPPSQYVQSCQLRGREDGGERKQRDHDETGCIEGDKMQRCQIRRTARLGRRKKRRGLMMDKGVEGAQWVYGHRSKCR